jgi:MoaA/NifB/PqqE/SkfB family radical SAM enzyme
MRTLTCAVPKGVMIEYTSRCNLRCRYCTKSNEGDELIPGRDMDMAPQTISRVLELISHYKFEEVLLAGTGETTFHQNWREDVPRITDLARRANENVYVYINTNFAINYGFDDWFVFQKLDGLVISIDTLDADLTKTVRAKSSIHLITHNILSFVSYCKKNNKRLPEIKVNITLYDSAVESLLPLLYFLNELPIHSVAVSDLVETKASKKFGVTPLNRRSKEFSRKIQIIQEAINKLTNLHFRVSFQPELIQRLNSEIIGANSQSVEPDQTKVCLQPWTRFTLAPDGAVYPCCVTDMPPVGSYLGGSPSGEDVLNREGIREFRQRLLDGNPPAPCIGCTNAPWGAVSSLREDLERLGLRER